MEGVTIPRDIKITSRFQDNSVELVRKRLRLNMINHLKYEPAT